MSEDRIKTNKGMKALLDDPGVRSWRALIAAFNSVYPKLEEGLRWDGFSVSRFQIFFALYFDGPMSAADIARRLIVTRGNISTFLARLINDKQIRIAKETKTKKRPLYKLTPKAERLFEYILPKHIERVKDVMPVFKPIVMRSLGKIADKRFVGKI